MPLTNITDVQLQMIEVMGSTAFTPEEIAEVIEIDKDEFLLAFNDRDSAVYKRFRKGFLESELKLRQRIFKDAGNGSSPAQTLAKKMMDECRHKLPDNAE